MYITRIAPSPTGMFHLGTARTAYFNYLAAKASGGKFILRIDDTDENRNRQDYVDIILQSLEWLTLTPDAIFFQSKRKTMYQGEAKGLLSRGFAKQLDNRAIVLKWPENMPSSYEDSISGKTELNDTVKKHLDGKIILIDGKGYTDKNGIEHPSREGEPMYNFASMVDDYFMKVNYIIRGVDHINNTPKQIAIWVALNNYYSSVNTPKALPKFSHLGLIHKDGKKLSKRDGAASLLWYKEQGYNSENILDWMLRLGWALRIPRGPESKAANIEASKFIFKERAIELFFNGNLKNSSCNYNLGTLKK